jgi:hypothetical protein
MKTTSFILFRGLVTLALLAGGASSGEMAETLASLPAGPNACALLSRPEVIEAVGGTVGDGELRLRTKSFTRCLFPTGSGGSAAILVRQLESADWASEQLGRLHRGTQFGTYREVAGIGQRAFLRETPQTSILCVFAETHYLQVSLFRTGAASENSAAVAKLAQIALARLRMGAQDAPWVTAIRRR